MGGAEGVGGPSEKNSLNLIYMGKAIEGIRLGSLGQMLNGSAQSPAGCYRRGNNSIGARTLTKVVQI